MKYYVTTFIIVFSSMFLMPTKNLAHCEIPCGIYGDSLRIALINEHISTIEKSMKEIQRLEKGGKDSHQMVRWIINKEEHAKKIQDIVSQYFLHQRIKPVDDSNKEAYDKYIEQLTLLHQVLIYAMKAKQSTDLKLIEKLYDTVHKFEHNYF